MFIEERHQEILKIINEKGRISIGEIQEKFNVSADSARRDLRILEEKALLKRTHGGAIPLMQVGILPPKKRDMKNMEVFDNYTAIAKKGSEFIKENDVIYLTSGSLGFFMLKYLPKNIKYTLVVNSITIAEELKYCDNITVYIVGGKMKQNATGSLVDSFATSFVKNMHFDISLITAGGVDAEFGLSTSGGESAAFQRAVIENTRKNILLMPNQKIGFKGFIKICDLNKFDTLVTDWDVPDDELLKFKDLGMNIIIVKKTEN